MTASQAKCPDCKLRVVRSTMSVTQLLSLLLNGSAIVFECLRRTGCGVEKTKTKRPGEQKGIPFGSMQKLLLDFNRMMNK